MFLFPCYPTGRYYEKPERLETIGEKDKDSKDYEKIGTELDVDTILEIGIISYGIKDPGFSLIRMPPSRLMLR